METKILTKTQQGLIERLAKLKQRIEDFPEAPTGFIYNENYDYNRKALIEKYPKLKESYINSRIEYVLSDDDMLNIWFGDFQRDINDLEFELFEPAIKARLIDPGVRILKNGHFSMEDNHTVDGDRYANKARIKLKWNLSNREDLLDEISYLESDAENQHGSDEAADIGKRITEMKKQIDTYVNDFQIIIECEKRLNDIFSKEHDLTDEIAYRIDEDEDAEVKDIYKKQPPPKNEDILRNRSEFTSKVMVKHTGGNYTNALAYPEREYHKSLRIIGVLLGNGQAYYRGENKEKDLISETGRLAISYPRMLIYRELNKLDDKTFCKRIRKEFKRKEIMELINQ